MLLKRISIFLVVILSCLQASAVSYPDSLLFKDYGEQYIYRFKFREATFGKDSAIAIEELSKIREWAQRKDDPLLTYGYRILTTEYYLIRTNADTGVYLKQLKDLIVELDRQNLKNLKAEAIFTLASFYWNKSKYSQAFEHDINAYKIYKDFKTEDFPGKPKFLFEFANHYYHFGDLVSAKGYFLKAYKENWYRDTSLLLSNLNSLALSYMNTGNTDSAEYYMKEGYAIASAVEGSIWTGIISGNLGHLYFILGDYDRAQPWFQNEMEAFGDKPSMNVANTLAVLTSIYIHKGEKEKALEYALQAYSILQNNENYTKRYGMCRMIYMGLARGYAANGDMDKAYKFLDSAMVAKDSVEKKVNANILAGIQHALSAQERVVEQEQFERDARNNEMLRNILIASIVLIVIIAGLLINRQRMKHAFSRKQLEAEKQYIESELETATKQMNSLVGSISEKNDLIETFTAELDRLREYLSADNLDKADATLSELQKTTIITEAEWEHFAEMFEKVNSGFLKRLNSKVRGLSPIETKFIMLSKLKLSTKEVASALGISPDSVRLNRKRLYAKLGLTEGEHSLQSLIESI